MRSRAAFDAGRYSTTILDQQSVSMFSALLGGGDRRPAGAFHSGRVIWIALRRRL